MNKKVREIIKMHLDAKLIKPSTPISMIDLSEGKREDVCAGGRLVSKYLEREVGAYKLSERRGLCIMVKSYKEAEGEKLHLQREQIDPDELLLDLVEKAQMQQTLYSVLRALDEWEYPLENVTNAEEELRTAVKILGKEIENIQKVLEGTGQSDGQKD